MKDFNILINGVGGQGLITLLKIISEAALLEGYDIRTSELHGLSQRGGSVEVHIRFGKKIYMPLVQQSKANLVLSLEAQEALNGIYYSSKTTVFVINKYQSPTFANDLSEKEILDTLKKTSKNVFLVPAGEICKKELGTDVVAGIYLLGYATARKFLPLNEESILKALEKVVPEKYLELNKKTLELAKKNDN